ncbi:MAG TPA: cytochrome P450 [Verrucomicrobiae bacterium]|nr:cytochrome P450 [Verrucomicrobiae bacterium]
MTDIPEIGVSFLSSNIKGPDGWRIRNLMRVGSNPIQLHLALVGCKDHYVSLSANGDARMVAGLTREAMEDLTVNEAAHWARPETGLLKHADGSQEQLATKAMSTSNGAEWDVRHRNVNTAFRSRDARTLFQGGMVETVMLEVEALSKTPSGGFEIDAFGFAKRLALRNVWKLLFGRPAKPGVDEHVDVLLNSAVSPLVAMSPRMWPFPYYWVSKALRGLYAWAKEIGDDKLTNPDDSIASLMVNRREADGSLPSVEKIYGDMTGLYLTGRDGPASDIAWTLFLLAAHPTHQRGLREDLLGTPGYDSPLLAAIINESRRLIPASFILNPRICTTSYELVGIKIPRGAMGFGSILARHHDPEVWANARSFDPERWLQPAFKPHRFDFIPFGLGKRRCVGDQFADLQTRIAVAEILRRFHVGLDPQATYAYQAVAVLTQPRPTNKLRFVPLKDAAPPAVQAIKGNVHDLAALPR